MVWLAWSCSRNRGPNGAAAPLSMWCASLSLPLSRAAEARPFPFWGNSTRGPLSWRKRDRIKARPCAREGCNLGKLTMGPS